MILGAAHALEGGVDPCGAERATQPSYRRYCADMTSTDPAAPDTHDEASLTEFLQQYGMGALGSRMGIELIEAKPGMVVARMPVEGNTQPYGLLHGGASAVLAETIGSIVSAIHAGPDSIVVGVDLNCTHHKSAQEGFVTGTATLISAVRTLACSSITVTDDDGRLICTARLTCLIRPRP
jgi:1,4-dihydroxy-2-naphthoyl-CoA hydrolase